MVDAGQNEIGFPVRSCEDADPRTVGGRSVQRESLYAAQAEAERFEGQRPVKHAVVRRGAPLRIRGNDGHFAESSRDFSQLTEAVGSDPVIVRNQYPPAHKDLRMLSNSAPTWGNLSGEDKAGIISADALDSAPIWGSFSEASETSS